MRVAYPVDAGMFLKAVAYSFVSKRMNDISCIVGGTVIDENPFPVLIGLSENAPYRLLNIRCLIKDRRLDAHKG
jgi:hypothetical protein